MPDAESDWWSHMIADEDILALADREKQQLNVFDGKYSKIIMVAAGKLELGSALPDPPSYLCSTRY